MGKSTRPKRASIKEVASYAGVSTGVVSRVVNNDPSLVIKEDTRQKVLDAVEKLSYTPNTYARSLRTRQSSMVGLMVVDITNPFIGPFIRGVQDVVNESGRFCFLCESQDDTATEIKLINEMFNRQVDGVIVATMKIDDPLIPLLKELDLKYVAATRSVPGIEAPSVVFDHEKSIRIALEHLMELGHRKIGYIMGHMHSYSGQMRMVAYRRILEENGLPFREEYVTQSNYFAEAGYSSMCKLLSQPDPPTAVICCNDVVAISAMRAALKMGFSVPDDVSVIGYNNIALSSAIHPALTTIDTPAYEVGKRAAKMIVDLIEGRSTYPKHLVVDTTLVVRASTGVCKDRG